MFQITKTNFPWTLRATKIIQGNFMTPTPGTILTIFRNLLNNYRQSQKTKSFSYHGGQINNSFQLNNSLLEESLI